ncbi:MAG: hypothetical protein P1U40_04420 [Coxiellaceae bacterium]|nr:hypothetical protein [Coxiellaceae bacterium]
MKKFVLAVLTAGSLYCSFAQASVVCHSNQQVNKPFSIDLKQCFKKFVFPFNDWAYFVFPGDFIPPQNVTISGNYLTGTINSAKDIKVHVLKRNYTLALQGEVDIHVASNVA